ncbi:MAG TPA: dihydroorotate dehydrogenase electron transfer subunit [Kofleriaceae bacterium]|nr:dihydroorotate dehydrogenase electron transfer subunit [Kofleriaceae bacterium]
MDYVVVPLADRLSLAPGTFVLVFEGCGFLDATRPGQFVMLRGRAWGSDPLLPRAFSLLDVRRGGPRGTEADILIKTTGKASRLLEHALPGAEFSLLGPLGTAFPEPSPDRVDWLVAGGVGLAPLYLHARRAQELGLAGQVTLFYGGRGAADLVLLDRIAATGCELVLATEDGARGTRGRVTAALDAALDRRSSAAAGRPPPTLMACGPDPMLVAVARVSRRHRAPCYLSLEGEMACGVGVCLACAVPCRNRPFRYTCVDGPVLPLDELAGPYAEGAA